MKIEYLWLDNSFKFEQLILEMQSIKNHIKKRKGWIYIAKNSQSSFLKIGRTSKTPFERAKTLSSAGILEDFEIIFALPTLDSVLLERIIHKKLNKYRVKKEFFSMTQEEAQKIISQLIEQTNQNISNFFDLEILSNDLDLIEIAFMKRRSNFEKSTIFSKKFDKI